MKVAAETGVDIRYAGEVLDKEELLKMHSEADFCFALSRFDTFNCAVLEGMAVGCIPVVSTDCGVFEILDNSSAVIVDMSVDGYIAKAAEEIASIWKDRNRYKAMAEKAYHIASQNTWNDVAENYWKLLSRG